jgi:hypothetical protein
MLAFETAPIAIATDGVNAYWSDNAGGSIVSCAVGGCGGNVTTVAPSVNLSALTTDGVNVFWTDAADGTINSCSVAGCTTPTVLVTGQSGAKPIAVDSKWVFWATTGNIMKTPKP